MENSITDMLTGSIESVALGLLKRRLPQLPDALLLILRHNGGELAEADRLMSFLELIKTRIPVWAYIHRALSAGYLICCGSNKIVLGEFGRVGSIGAFSIQLDLSKILAHLGVTLETATGDVCTYSFGTIGSDESYSSAAASKISTAFEHYLGILTSQRGIGKEALNEIKSGKIFFDFEAVKVSLVDTTGTLLNALLKLEELIGHGRRPTVQILSNRAPRLSSQLIKMVKGRYVFK